MKVRKVVKEASKAWLTAKAQRMRWGAQRWTVLCLHDVGDPAEFEELIAGVRKRFRIVPLSEGRRLLEAGRPDRPLLSLTFDDADKSVWSKCVPVLRSNNIPACLFVCTNYVEAGFRDVSTGRHEVMDWDELRGWVALGYEVGSHTVSHIPLNQATVERGKWEILESRRILQERLNCEVRHFAYPWGYYTDQLDNWLQAVESFATICVTIPCDNYPGSHSKHVYRKPWGLNYTDLRTVLREPSWYEMVRSAHHRSVLNGLAPVLWRMSDGGVPDQELAASSSVASGKR
jgi:peptidoglycan/xylan/chitin deacetylase (PgdA/CDA1 family)